MRAFKKVIKINRQAVLLFVIFTLVTSAVSVLYSQKAEPVVYASAVSLFFLTVMTVKDSLKERVMSRERSSAAGCILDGNFTLPGPRNAAEEDYQKMIVCLAEKVNRLSDEYSAGCQERMDYYTAWVHQIKTPISVLRLKLSEDTPENRALSAEVFRIEQYVDMVLQYTCLESETNDLVIEEYSLDEIIRSSVRKYASQFIEKKLSVNYVPTQDLVVTDKKWFGCILDQLLSNAVKYTKEGTITIIADGERLAVKDTGIGIAAEDIPRIFEKGYTGINGRSGQKSSGLGLYLAKKASDMLSVSLSVESTAGEGSSFILTYDSK